MALAQKFKFNRFLGLFFVLWTIPLFLFHGWFLMHPTFQNWYIIGGIIFMGLFPAVISLRSIAKFSQSGMQISEKVWDITPGETVHITDLWPALGPMVDVMSGRGSSPKQTLEVPTFVETGMAHEIPFQIITLGGGAPTDFIQVRATFPGTFPGKLQLMPQIGFVIGHDQSLESLDFNRQVIVYGPSMEVAYKILSPDLMAWYLGLKNKPVILFDQKHGFLTFQQPSSLPGEKLKELIGEYIDRVMRSGALESVKKITASFPKVS